MLYYNSHICLWNWFLVYQKKRKIKLSKKTFQISCITWARWAIKKYLRYWEGWGYEKPLSLRSLCWSILYCDTVSLVTYKLKFAWLAELFYWFHKVAESGSFFALFLNSWDYLTNLHNQRAKIQNIAKHRKFSNFRNRVGDCKLSHFSTQSSFHWARFIL